MPQDPPPVTRIGSTNGQASWGSPKHARRSSTPLPRRVRQASLSKELRSEPPAEQVEATVPAPAPDRAPGPVGATIGAFQRQSRRLHGAERTPPQEATYPTPPDTSQS
jgi:hypothetical protein